MLDRKSPKDVNIDDDPPLEVRYILVWSLSGALIHGLGIVVVSMRGRSQQEIPGKWERCAARALCLDFIAGQ